MYNLLEKWHVVRQNDFIRSVGVLAGSTVAAQGLTILALPILTRLYSPEDFSALAIYVAILTLISTSACLRFDVAIPLPKKDDDAAHLLALSLFFVLVVGLIMAVIVWLWGEALIIRVNQPKLLPFKWLLPFGVLMAGSYSAAQYWSIRKKRFKKIASTKLIQSGSGLSSQIGFGLAGVTPFGLIVGHTIMAGTGAVGLLRTAWRDDRMSLRCINCVTMIAMLKTYRRFPQFSIAEELANNAAIQVPIFIISTLVAGPEVGFIFLAMRAIGTPVSLIGNAVAQVFYSRAPSDENDGALAEITETISVNLAKIMIGPLILLGILAPIIFPIVFGAEWGRSGELVSWMTPWFIFRAISSPISMVMYVKMLQKRLLLLTTFGFFLRIVPMIIIFHFFSSYLAEVYAITGALFYAICFVTFLRSAGVPIQNILKLIPRTYLYWFPAVFVGLAIRFAWSFI